MTDVLIIFLSVMGAIISIVFVSLVILSAWQSPLDNGPDARNATSERDVTNACPSCVKRDVNVRGTMTCPRRMEMVICDKKPNMDSWTGVMGGVTCSFCGSMHPDIFMKRVEEGEVAIPTDKDYKAYLGVSGYGKFYYQHLSLAQQKRFYQLVKEGGMKIGSPGHFYVLPFFFKDVSEGGVTTDANDPSLTHGIDDKPTPQAGKYLVLSPEERAKGFVRPVRRAYVHKECGTVTTMNLALAETYSAKPDFYSATYCVKCQKHRPVAEFTWQGTNEQVGS